MLLLQAGAQRLSALANLSESGASAALDGDAIPKLLHLLEHSDDQGARGPPWIMCHCMSPRTAGVSVHIRLQQMHTRTTMSIPYLLRIVASRLAM